MGKAVGQNNNTNSSIHRSADNINQKTFQEEAKQRQALNVNHEKDITKPNVGPNSDAYQIYIAQLLVANIAVLQQRNNELFNKLANEKKAEELKLILQQIQAEESKKIVPHANDEQAVNETKEVTLPIVLSNLNLFNNELQNYYIERDGLLTQLFSDLMAAYDIANLTKAIAAPLGLSNQQVQQINNNVTAQMQRLHNGNQYAIEQVTEQTKELRQAIAASEVIEAETRDTLLNNFFVTDYSSDKQNLSDPVHSSDTAAKHNTSMFFTTMITETQRTTNVTLEQLLNIPNLLNPMQTIKLAVQNAYFVYGQKSHTLNKKLAQKVNNGQVYIPEAVANQVLGRGHQAPIFQQGSNPMDVIRQIASGPMFSRQQNQEVTAPSVDNSAPNPFQQSIRVR